MTDPDPSAIAARPAPGARAFAAGFALVSAFLLSRIATQVQWFDGMPVTQQPGFWPAVSLGAMTLFAALHLLAVLAVPAPGGEGREALVWLRGVEFIGWYIAYAQAVLWIGYLAATVLLMVALVWRLGLRDRASLWAAAGFGAGVVVLFKTALSVRIPGGAIYDLLPGAWRAFMVTYF